MEEEVNIDQMIEKLTKNKIEQFKIEINNYQNELVEQINEKFKKFDESFNKNIEEYTQKIKNKIIINNDVKKEINIDEIRIPPLICLKKLDNTNYLINLILQYFSNIKSIVSYFFNPKKQIKIFQNLNGDPTGNYLCPAFLKLFENLWKGTNKIYQPKEIHDILKRKQRIYYISSNPGKILNDIIMELHQELISDKDKYLLEKPDGNFNEKKAKDQFDTYSQVYKSIISVQFFSTIKKIIKIPGKPNFYLFDTTPIIEIFLDNGKSHALTLEHDFKKLFKNYNEQIDQALIQEMPYQLIININRGNNNKSFLYPRILECKYLLEKNNPGKYDLCCVIMKNNNNHYAYLKNCINSKWYLYIDELIQQVNEENQIINEKKALLLIYQYIKEEF